ncbi:hypothetical protein BD769DRAFT_1502355 [Suillus cothurnatus]|nr:hypothetical protein BD769DRAFT_1502355 [Suillus cothurnatus]
MTDAANTQAMDLVYTTESTTYRTNKFHELIELSRANSTELHASSTLQGSNSQTIATYSCPTHPHPSSLTFPTHADSVVIGSGITGTSFVRRILDSASADGHDVRVVVLGARDVCSGR